MIFPTLRHIMSKYLVLFVLYILFVFCFLIIITTKEFWDLVWIDLLLLIHFYFSVLVSLHFICFNFKHLLSDVNLRCLIYHEKHCFCVLFIALIVESSLKFVLLKLYWFSFHFIFLGLWLLLVSLFPWLCYAFFALRRIA